MKLSTQDTDLFFKLMWSLQLYVSQKHQLFPEITTVEAYRKLSAKEKITVRSALYKDVGQIAAFVRENPRGLSPDELAIVASWQNLVADKFFIERLLKKYAVFIQGKKVFGVLALYDDFDEILGGAPLPVYVETALLPFKGQIIYDGLMQRYSVYFGGGISSGLKETYLTAKQNGTIIESLDSPNPQPKQKIRIQKDWRPEVEELISKAAQLKTGADDPVALAATFSLVKASLGMAQAATSQPDDLDALRRALKKVHTAAKKIETALDRAEYV